MRIKEPFFGLLAFLIIYFQYSLKAYSQYHQLSENSQISVLTIGPGTSLNDAFGHSAYRVKDDKIDIVFNYGVYDFDTPNFYTKFAQGKLNYKIGANYYDDFLASYIRQNRTIEEQILDLSLNERQQLFNYLSKNYEPANQYYLYDFFFDNCATKIKDVLAEVLGSKIEFREPNSFEVKTFRKLIQEKLRWNTWGSLGIDVALGSVIDRDATPNEHMFLPEYIHIFFGEALLNSDSKKKLVLNEQIIYQKKEKELGISLLKSPILILSILGLFLIFLTYKDFKKLRRSKWIDMVLFTFTGLAGIIILLLWFATDHDATANNYNLLWAFALNIFMLFQLHKLKPKPWFVRYIKFLILMLVLMIMHWLIGIQIFAPALLPLILVLLIRYFYLIYYYRSQNVK